MTEVEQQPLAQNGIDLSAAEEYDNSKSRPADIEQDMREMERRKRVEAIMSSKLFREELERIVDSARDGGTSGIIQQLSDIVGIPMSRVGSMFRASSSLLPINDIRGVESMGYAKGEKILRCKLAATFRLLDLYGWTEGLGAQVTARLKVDQEYFLVNPYGLLYNEITASALNKVDMQGQIVEQGTTNFGINKNHFILHSVIHAARPDIRCAIYIGCNSVVAISSVKTGLLPITKDACVLGEVTTYNYTGYLYDEEERNKLVRNLGPNSKVMLLSNHGALCCGETIEEAFFAACHIVRACETQLKLLPIDVDNLILIPEETRKLIYDHARRPPEDLDKKHIISSSTEAQADVEDTAKSPTKIVGTATPKWRVGGAEFEALMRMLDNAGFRTGYIYRHPLVKSEPPKPKNDVELPPAVSSLGYLLEEEELFRQGIWKRGDLRKGGDRSRWLNSPNVYQKVEVLETGTPDPKKITKWVAEGSPTHSTPVRIEDPLQFVPVNTNPREFKRVQQQIKDNRRADKISAGPQSHILEGVTWDEANRIKDANVNSSSDHVVLVGAASKGIIQRGFQHNATVYKAPYAKNPFDCVTDDELNEYKRTVERKKKSIYGEYTDTDFSESEALSSQQTSGAQQPQIKEMTTTKTPTTAAAISQSEPEDISEPQVMRIQTQQAPVRSQPEIVLSDATMTFINDERSHTAKMRKAPTRQDMQETDILEYNQESNECFVIKTQDFKTNKVNNRKNTNSNKNNTKKKKKNNNSISYYGPLEVDGPNNHLCQKSPTPWQQRPPRNRNQNSKQALINELKDESILFKRQREKNSVAFNEINKETGQYNTEQILCNVEKSTNNGNESNNLPCKTSRNVPTRNGNGNVKISSNDNGNTSSNANIKLTDLISHIDDDIGGELYDDIYPCYTNSLNGNIQQHMNSMSVSSDDYVYECINPKNIHKKSRYCCTPNICAALLRSIGKNSQNLQNDTSRGTANDLIWNIPFCREISYSNSPLSTPEKQSIGVRQSRMDVSPKRFCLRYRRHISTKSQSPYRTVSHFGFNSPQRDPRPDHKHIPLTDDIKKYVPLRRSISYEELFASPRFLEICEHCFEKLVRLKPEFIQNRTKLRNLSECQHSCGIMQTITNSSPPGCIKSYTSGTGIGNKSPSDIVKAHLNGDIVEQHMEDNINTGITAKKSFTLEPLIEMEERVKSGSFLPAKVDKPLIQKSHPINITKSIVDSKVLLPIQHHIAQFERNDNMNSYDITKKSITERISNRELRCLQLGRRANMNNMVDTYTSITEMLEFNNSLNGCNTEAENEPDFTKATEREMVSVMVQTDVVDMINAGTNASLDDTNSDGEWDATITTAEEQNSKQEWLKGISNVMVQPEILDMPNTENNIFANDNNSDTEWEVTITTAEEHNVEQGWPQEIACVMIQTDSLDILNKSNSKSHYTEINTALNYNNCDANREATITTARERNSEKEKPQEVTYSAEQTDPMDVINNVQLLSEKLQTSTISHYTEFNSCLDNYSNNTEKDATHNISDENTESKWPSEVTCSMIQTEPIVIVNKTQSIFGKWPSSDNSRPTKSNSSLYEKSSNAAWVTTLTTGINENVKQKCPQGMTYAMAKPPLRYIMNRSERAKRKLKFQQLWESHASFSKESKPILPANSYKTIEYDVDEEHDMLESKQQQNFKLTSSSLTSTDSSYENAWSIVDEMQGENKHQQNGKLASPSSPTCTSSSYKNAESIINEVHWENEQHQNFKQVPSSLTAIDNSYKNDGSIVDKVRWENEKQRNFKLTFVSLTNTDKNTVATVHEVQGENEQMLNVRQTSPFSPTSTNSSYKNAKSIDDEVQGGNIQRENFELTFPSSPMTTDSQEGNEMEISLDAETFYGQSVISHNLTKDHTKIKIMTDDDLHNIDIFPSTATTTSPLDYKSSLDNFLLYSQPTKEVKKLLSSTPTESIGNCSSSNLIKEFEKIVLDDYKSNSNIGKNFKDALKELQSFQIPVNNSTENIQTVCNNTNNSKEILENDLQQNFTPIEREILEKIQMNQLNKTDEIFDKIEKTVRNRRVPGKLDMVIMDKDICVSSTQSESNAGRKHYNHMLNDCGTSRSLTILNDNVMLAATGNKTLLLKKSECVIQNTKKSYPGNNTIKCTTTNNPPALSKSRNFILENIRNASKPSRCINENNFNRLRGLSNQNQNQASCSLTNLTLSNTAISARPITPMKSDDSINIYSFQSKSIKGAPKFWLSMSNSPANSSAKSLSSSYQRCEQHKETYLKEAKQQNHNIKGKRHMDNMGNGDNYNDKEKTTTVIRPMTLAIATATQVNAEINALREEIHKIQPHVENHTNKVENFGNRISKYARGSAQQE